jgi:hypothetical protein
MAQAKQLKMLHLKLFKLNKKEFKNEQRPLINQGPFSFYEPQFQD